MAAPRPGKELRQLLAQFPGWVATRTKKGWRLHNNGGAIVSTALTPSDWRALHNTRAWIRRATRQIPKI